MFDNLIANLDTFENVKSVCYIAIKEPNTEDVEGNPITNYKLYDKNPLKYNIQYVDKKTENLDFGENITGMKVAVITGEEKVIFENNFKEKDLVYLEGNTPDGETVIGENANYEIFSIRSQNVALKVYFKKIE